MGEKKFLQTSFLSFIDAKTFELICTRRGKKNLKSWGNFSKVWHLFTIHSNLHFSCMVECKANVGCHFNKKE
jgi:hypothetical protein